MKSSTALHAGVICAVEARAGGLTGMDSNCHAGGEQHFPKMKPDISSGVAGFLAQGKKGISLKEYHEKFEQFFNIRMGQALTQGLHLDWKLAWQQANRDMDQWLVEKGFTRESLFVERAEDALQTEKLAEKQFTLDSIAKAVLALAAESRANFKSIETGLQAVAQGNLQLRKENDDLKHLKKDGFLEFGKTVDRDDFRFFLSILAMGNRKQAADLLGVPPRTLYDRVDKWAGRGGEYAEMALTLERWKNSEAKRKVRMSEEIESGEPSDAPENPEVLEDLRERNEEMAHDNRDYPTLLRQFLEILEEQNVNNWPKVKRELLEMIREEGL